MRIFGRQKSVEDQPPAHPTVHDVQQLAAFSQLSERQLTQVAEASFFEQVAGGRLDLSNPEALTFLHQGAVSIESDDRPRIAFTHEQSAHRFSLPADKYYRVNALSDCRLMKVPARFLILAAHKPSLTYSTSWRTSGTEDHPFMALYEDIKNGRCELPSMPDLATRIGKVIDDPTTASEHIARVIQTDPALAARVMSVVNSAAFRTGSAISNLSQAVSRLGREHIRNLVFSFIVKGMFTTDCSHLKKRMMALWVHSCHVGAIASVLARHTPGLDPERALLSGLVHDIGVVPILDRARHHEGLLQKPELFDELIEQLRGEVGGQTMREWGFDQSFIDIAARSEDWMRAGDVVPDYLDVVILAQLHAYVGTPRMKTLPRVDDIPAFHKLAGGKLTPRGSMQIIEKASREVDALRQLLATG